MRSSDGRFFKKSAPMLFGRGGFFLRRVIRGQGTGRRILIVQRDSDSVVTENVAKRSSL